MKAIEAVVAPEKLDTVSQELKKAGFGSLTIFDTKGRGQKPIERVATSRGTGTFTPEFNTNCSLLIVVKDSDVDKAIQAISSASTGLAGEGKIFVSKVEEAIDIGTKQKGDAIL